MSLIHRRKSVIFNTPETTASKLKIQQLLQAHKSKLSINNRSSSKPKISQKEKLSLGQAVKLEQLQQHMSHNSQSRKMSLNCLLNGFDQNCVRNIQEQGDGIDGRKMDLFRSGLHYRSVQRAQGAGIRRCAEDDLKQYFNCQQSFNNISRPQKITPQQIRKPKLLNLGSTSAFSTPAK